MKVGLEFKGADLWIGAFWKRAEGMLHIWICVLPCFPLHIQIPSNASPLTEPVAKRKHRSMANSDPYRMHEKPAQELRDGYIAEMVKIKAYRQARERGERRPSGAQYHANTAKMNQYWHELERRGLPIPQVQPSEEEKSNK